jgi:hypothetical protein
MLPGVSAFPRRLPAALRSLDLAGQRGFRLADHKPRVGQNFGELSRAAVLAVLRRHSRSSQDPSRVPVEHVNRSAARERLWWQRTRSLPPAPARILLATNASPSTFGSR